MQNRIHYFRWTAGLIVVTSSFLTGTKNDKYGILVRERVDKLLQKGYEIIELNSGVKLNNRGRVWALLGPHQHALARMISMASIQ